MSAPLIYVDLIEEQPQTIEEYGRRRSNVTVAAYQKYLDRFQPWRWVALSGDNQKRLARSSERYFNRADALKAIRLLFKTVATVYLREAEHGNVLLRMAA